MTFVQNRFILSLLFLLLLQPLVDNVVVVVVGATSTELAANQRTFSDDLTGYMYENENECTSSLGVSMAFSLLYPSMTGTAKEEVQTAFGFPEDNKQLVWSETETELEGRYPTGTGTDDATVLISNSIWVDTGSELDSSYSSTVSDYVEQVDFNDEASATVINNWVKTATNDLIDSIIDPDTLRQAVIVAINAIYLKAAWVNSFSASDTNQDTFYTSAARTEPRSESAWFMHQVEEFPYSQDALDGYQVLKLPLFGQALSMVFVLPMTNSGTLVSSNDIVTTALPNLVTQRVAVAIPKFELTVTYQAALMQALQDGLGVVAPFRGGLCVFENDCGTSIDLVVQKTYISVDEDGVEAAAVTAIVGVTSLPMYDEEPPLFLADHPFQFFIYDEGSDVVLFEGFIGNPEPQSDAPAAEMEANHADADFWDRFNVNPVEVLIRDTQSDTTPTPVPATPAPALAGKQGRATLEPTQSPANPEAAEQPTPESSSYSFMHGSTAFAYLLSSGCIMITTIAILVL